MWALFVWKSLKNRVIKALNLLVNNVSMQNTENVFFSLEVCQFSYSFKVNYLLGETVRFYYILNTAFGGFFNAYCHAKEI